LLFASQLPMATGRIGSGPVALDTGRWVCIIRIKTLRGVFEAIHGMPLGLREAKLTCDALQDRDDAQIVIRCETKLAGLVRTALSAADFRLHQPERETILYV
jgi:hypothetical protein